MESRATRSNTETVDRDTLLGYNRSASQDQTSPLQRLATEFISRESTATSVGPMLHHIFRLLVVPSITLIARQKAEQNSHVIGFCAFSPLSGAAFGTQYAGRSAGRKEAATAPPR